MAAQLVGAVHQEEADKMTEAAPLVVAAQLVGAAHQEEADKLTEAAKLLEAT